MNPLANVPFGDTLSRGSLIAPCRLSVSLRGQGRAGQLALLCGSDDLRHRVATVLVEPVVDTVAYLDGDGRINEVGRTNLDSRGSSYRNKSASGACRWCSG